MNPLFEILHEDADLLALNKPADLVCHPTKGDVYSSLISRVRLHLGEGSEPQLINRLDRETSGVVIVAKNPEAARELRRLWEAGQVQKRYDAIVHGCPAEREGIIDAPLGKDERSVVAIKDCVRPDGAAARTKYSVTQTFQRAGQTFSLLSVHPLNGRKHQIRIHLAHLGHSIVGDKLYGGDERCYLDLVTGKLSEEQRRWLMLPNQALHAGEVRLTWRGKEWVFQAEPECWFTAFAEDARIHL